MPDERSGVLVPGVDPGADGRFELLGRAVRAATEPFVRQLREPPLDEVVTITELSPDSITEIPHP